eukprot:TRINITY_DN1762_c0_g1_i1.p2 TRINITY_DN1762_c0_g1~~TRINITY_DN1762_c0_g1_i1.p2  ORF type:complete len:120 (+),score=62.21 TRINITY_DN1762_c0_g1_i1:72-431(+)
MATDPQVKRDLTVKMGTLKRNLKDLTYAEKEIARERQRLETMSSPADGAAPDEFRLRQQRQCVEEAVAMVPEARKRIAEAAAALSAVLQSAQIGADLEEQRAEAAALCEQAQQAAGESG